MKRSYAKHALLVVGLAFALAGCPGSKGEGAAADAGKKSSVKTVVIPASASSTVASTSASTSASQNTPSIPPRMVTDVGEVPPWSGDPKQGACILSPTSRAKVVALAKGDDATLSTGTADVGEIIRLTAGPCATARRDLARAFDEGGKVRLAAKAPLEAARWFAAGVHARPAWGPARGDLSRALFSIGKKAESAAELDELARGAKAGDASASAAIVSAIASPELSPIEGDAALKPRVTAAIEATVTATFRGPVKDDARALEAAKLVPMEFALQPGDIDKGMKKLNPVVVSLYSWHPAAGADLFVASIIGDGSMIDKPIDATTFGGIGVFRLVDGKLTLLLARRTGLAAPFVGPTNDGVSYEMHDLCGDLHGVLRWSATAVSIDEQGCTDI